MIDLFTKLVGVFFSFGDDRVHNHTDILTTNGEVPAGSFFD